MSRLSSRRLDRLMLMAIGIAIMFNLSKLSPGAAAQAEIDAAEIDRFVAEQIEMHNLPGVALAITHDDEVVHAQGYGNARAGQPMTAQTQLFIASVSKSFTALAVMQLVDAAQIDIDAPLQDYLPEFTLTDPSAASQITIRHLLNQTSGLSDAGYPEGRLPQPVTFDELLSSLRRARPVATPGTEYHYFNPNYQLLARVVEVASGEPFSTYLETHIFAPLQMTDTLSAITSDEAMQSAKGLAQGHILAFGFPVGVQEMSGFIAGSGGIISTAEDIANFLIMQNNDGRFAGTEVVSPSSLDLMHSAPQTLDSNYAMGWIETSQEGTRILEHNGIFSAFYADIALLPETRDGIILLYNANSFAANALAAPRIKSGLIALLTDRQPQTGGVSIRLVGALLAVATLIGAVLGIRSLLRLPQWRQKAKTLPRWRLLLGLTGTFAPAIILVGMPALVTASSGRAFSYAQLFRSMTDIFIWLGIGTVLGVINGVLRILYLVRGRR